MKAWRRAIAALMCLVAGCAGPAKVSEAPRAHAEDSRRSALGAGSGSSAASAPGATNAGLLPTSDRAISPGIRLRTFETRFKQTVWVYTGEPPPPHPGLMLIAPAGGSPLFAARLGSGDTPEHVPYVGAGYTVVSYSLSGPIPEDSDDTQKVAEALSAFINSTAGTVDGMKALAFALEQFPELDPKRVIAAGHSSAGTLALLLAASDRRIKGVIAYAPEPEPGARLSDQEIATMTEAMPNFRDFLRFTAPLSRVPDITVPVFLFHSKADDNVPTARISRFASALRKHHCPLTFDQVERGDHYGSMIDPGIARALIWLGKTYPPPETALHAATPGR
jgi:dienelactone hydrolase